MLFTPPPQILPQNSISEMLKKSLKFFLIFPEKSFPFLLDVVGKIRAWKFPSGKSIFNEETPSLCIQGHEESDVAPNMPGIVQCFPNEALDCLVTVTDEHNIILRELSTLKVMKQVLLFAIFC